MVARRDGRRIVWPKPTHSAIGGKLPKYRTAADIINWKIPCKSIFGRKRPLAENTLKRIAKGLEKYVFSGNPFIAPSEARIVPFITEHANASNQRNMPINEPLHTLTTENRYGMVSAFLAKHYTGVVGDSLGNPLPTVTTVNHNAIVTAFMTKFRSGSIGYDVNSPIHTITAGGEQKRPGTANTQAVVTSHMIKLRNNCVGSSVSEPVHTITASGGHIGEVRAFLFKYYGNNGASGCDEPLHTVTTKDRFGLVTVAGEEYQIVDIGMRMLEPRELFDASGFPSDYIIDVAPDGKPISKAKQVARCGNAVPPPFAKALVEANLPETCQQRKLEVA